MKSIFIEMYEEIHRPKMEILINMHSGLRKVGDSTISSLAWNVISMVKSDSWGLFGFLLCDTRQATEVKFMRAANEFHDLFDKSQTSKIIWDEVYALQGCFELFDQGDWDALWCYIEGIE